jgi:hypothetical protein
MCFLFLNFRAVRPNSPVMSFRHRCHLSLLAPYSETGLPSQDLVKISSKPLSISFRTSRCHLNKMPATGGKLSPAPTLRTSIVIGMLKDGPVQYNFQNLWARCYCREGRENLKPALPCSAEKIKTPRKEELEKDEPDQISSIFDINV